MWNYRLCLVNNIIAVLLIAYWWAVRIWFSGRSDASSLIVAAGTGFAYAVPIFCAVLMRDLEGIFATVCLPFFLFLYGVTYSTMHAFSIARIWDLSWGNRPGGVTQDTATAQKHDAVVLHRKRISRVLIAGYILVNMLIAIAASAAGNIVGNALIKYLLPVLIGVSCALFVFAAIFMVGYTFSSWRLRDRRNKARAADSAKPQASAKKATTGAATASGKGAKKPVVVATAVSPTRLPGGRV
jgi:hypothetical protein